MSCRIARRLMDWQARGYGTFKALDVNSDSAFCSVDANVSVTNHWTLNVKSTCTRVNGQR
jgi:hypothetical protein